MSDIYIELLENQLEKVGMRMINTIRMYSGHLRTDLPVRTMMMTLVNPMEDRILKESEFRSTPVRGPLMSKNPFTPPPEQVKEEIEEKTEDKPKAEKANSWWSNDEGENGKNDTKPENTITVESEPYVKRKYDIGLEVSDTGKYIPTFERKPLEIPERENQKRDSLITLREFTGEHSKIFNLADLVEAGFTNLRPTEWSSIDFDYIRGVSYELYIHYVLWIMMDMEMSVEANIIEYLSHEGMDYLRNEVVSLVSKLSVEDIVNSLGINEDELRSQETTIKEKVKLLDVGLKKAKHALRFFNSPNMSE